MKVNYRLLTEADIEIVDPWFDDPDTKKYLGGKAWPRQLLKLVDEMPGKEFKGKTIRGRYAFLVFLGQTPVALIDLETYGDATAALAPIVAPNYRGRGIAKQIHSDVWEFSEMKGIDTITGGLDPDNIASIKSLDATGAIISEKMNAEGQFETLRSRPKKSN